MTIPQSALWDQVADLLEPDGAWTQRQFARNVRGRSVTPDSKDAVCWCVEGALSKVKRGKSSDAQRRSLRAKVGDIPTVWNDAPERTQAEVVATVRELAAELRGKGE